VLLPGAAAAAACCRGRKLKADNDEDAAYDRAARELVFEAKGQVGWLQPGLMNCSSICGIGGAAVCSMLLFIFLKRCQQPLHVKQHLHLLLFTVG
jgi:hypothetical protein